MVDLSLILLNTSWGIYSVLKESKYTVVFVSINNKTQCVPLLFYHWDLWYMLLLLFHICSFFYMILFLFLWPLRKTPLNLGFSIICLVVWILLNGWSGTKFFYTNDLYYYIFLLLEQLFMSLQLLF